jgi:threonine dehydrogenase-like Zn-dependent dehydrogenase
MQTCRAAVFNGDGTYEVREFPVPLPPPGGAVLAVEAVGLCASDVAQLHGHKHVPGEVSPVVPGHEIVGRVHALAPGADLGVRVGDRVAVDLVWRCGTCAVCRSGSPYCEQMQLYGYTQGLDVGTGLHGGYGEYMEVRPNSHLLPLTDDVPASQLSLFEPLANVVNWFDRVDLQPGERVVIQGPGHMGLICAAYAKLLGAGTVIVTGRGTDRFRLDAALTIGADHVVDVDDLNAAGTDLVSAVAELTDGRLADVAVDLTDAAVTVGTCLELARMGGRVLWAGLKNMAQVAMISDLVPLKGLTVVGGAGSTAASMEKATAVLNAGGYPTAALQGETFTLDSLDEAMALLTRTAPGRDAVRVGLVHH